MRLSSLIQRAQRLAAIDADHFALFVSPLGDPNMQYPEPILAYICGDCKIPGVELLNILPIPVEVLSMDMVRKEKVSQELAPPMPRSSFSLELPGTKNMRAATSVYVESGVSVYTKNPEYGPAQAVFDRIDMQNVGTDVFVQLGKLATVDGVAAAEKPFDTDTLY